MTQFLGTHRNRLDAKGRVTIPAPFRAALKAFVAIQNDPENGHIVLRPSHRQPCIEAWPQPVFNSLGAPLDRVEMFSAAYEDLAATVYADAFPMEPDREGRIVLPDELAAHAGLTDSVVFMGLGRTFSMWEPAAADRYRAEARARVRDLSLPMAVRT
jgi:MraZ protein